MLGILGAETTRTSFGGILHYIHMRNNEGTVWAIAQASTSVESLRDKNKRALVVLAVTTWEATWEIEREFLDHRGVVNLYCQKRVTQIATCTFSRSPWDSSLSPAHCTSLLRTQKIDPTKVLIFRRGSLDTSIDVCMNNNSLCLVQ